MSIFHRFCSILSNVHISRAFRLKLSILFTLHFQILFLTVLALIALTGAEPEPKPEPYYGYGIWGPYNWAHHPYAWKHPAIECDEETCMTCKESLAGGPILATNCRYECGLCALCGAAKAKGLEDQVAKCDKFCGDGIFACTKNCLAGQDKCLACAPKCGKF